MAKNHKIPKCPPLRFPEFADEWKQTTLGEIAEIIQTRGKSNTLYLSVESFLPNFRGISVSLNGIQSSGVIFGTYDTLMSNIRPYLRKVWYADCGGTCSSDVLVFRGKSVIHPRFLYTIIANQSFVDYTMQGAKGVKMPRGDKQQMLLYSLSLPSLAEQKKIASFLSLIDERIQCLSETIKEIKTLKAGLLSLRVYQADKQYVPLSYFGEMKHGYPFKSTSYDEDGTHRIVTISNVSGARYADMSKCNYLAELPHDIQQHQILSRNDILISLTGNVGRVSFCLADGDLLNQRVGVLSLCDEAYKEYIYQVLSDWRFEMSMVACGQGAAQLNISKSNVEGYLVPYEQSEYQEIGNFFSLLDDRIEIEEALLKQYEMQKKYLLRQMFI
jgi:hypothetical protein